MGLENGIRLENQKCVVKKVPFFVDIDKSGDICYWCRCRGIRQQILNCLEEDGNRLDGMYYLDDEDVREISKVLKKFRSKKYCLKNAYHKEYEYYTRISRKDVWKLRWLSHYMKSHPQLRVFFYDSY